MKKQLLHLFTGLLLAHVLFGLGCSKLNHTRDTSLSPAHTNLLGAWFEQYWNGKGSSANSASRSSAWAHDTNFVQNNYANLTLEWRFAKIYQRGDTTYTEVPATLKDTLEFKIGSTDSLSLQAELSDSIYRRRAQSKTLMVFREVPGDEIYAEAATFIADYNYTKTDYQRFVSSIGYFELNGYSGLVMYHDRSGALLRCFEYVKGQITNTVRCVEMRGLDPAPDNRAHQEKCYEVLTWERECVTTYTQYGYSTECGEWYLVGSYMIGNCFADETGGGTSAPPAYEPISEKGLDCGSFDFRSTAGNWQEAGVRNLRINFRWIGGSRNGESIEVTLGAPIVFGIPKTRSGGISYSPGQAAMLAAQASDFAHTMTAQILKNEPYRPNDHVIEETYRRWVNMFMQNYGGTAGRTGSGSPQIVFRNAQYTLFGQGNCQ